MDKHSHKTNKEGEDDIFTQNVDVITTRLKDGLNTIFKGSLILNRDILKSHKI